MQRALQIGIMAQTRVKLWAEEQGITATRPSEDLHGWDLFLEMPASDGEAAVTCLVQVKATDSRRGVLDVKLRNFKKLVEQPHPCFFVILEYGGRDEPQDLFLVHVWEEWIGLTLRRLRQLEARGEECTPRHTLRLSWSDHQRLEPIGADALRRALRAAIGQDQFAYLQEKKGIIESVGYARERHRGTISIDGSSPNAVFRTLSEHAIGLTEAIDIKGFTILEDRFGILMPLPVPTGRPQMRIAAGPASRSALLRLFNNAGDSITEDCRIYRAVDVFPFLPERFRKARLESDAMQVVVDPAEERLTISASLPKSSEAWPFARMHRTARVLRLLARAAADGLHAEFVGAARPLDLAQRSIAPARFDERHLPILDLIEDAARVLQAYGIDDREPVAMKDLLDSGEVLARLAELVAGPVEGGRCSATITLNGRPMAQEAIVITPLAADIGRYCLGAVLGLTGPAAFEQTEAEGEWLMRIDRCESRIIDLVPMRRADKVEERLNERVEQARAQVEGTVPVILTLRAARV